MILLDTHVLLWLRQGSKQLGTDARKQIDQAFHSDDLAVCSISFWEVALLKQKGRIQLNIDISTWRHILISQGLKEIGINGEIGIMAAELPAFHPDPADRLIVSSCLTRSATLVTADRDILNWDANLHRIDAQN